MFIASFDNPGATFRNGSGCGKCDERAELAIRFSNGGVSDRPNAAMSHNVNRALIVILAFRRVGLRELRDAYKFAVGFALAKGVVPPEIQTKRQTMFAIATVDPDGSLATAIRELLPCDEVPPYRWAERLAEAGSQMIADIEATKGFDLGSMLADAELPSRDKVAER